MANFDLYLPLLRANEGGYCQTYGDSGGETYRGVSRSANPDWPGWAIVESTKAQQGLPALPGVVSAADWPALDGVLEADVALGNDVVALYVSQYWNPLQLSQVTSQALANQLMDHGVNTGPWRPAKMVQYLLSTMFGVSLTIDAVLGPASVAAINQVSQSHGPQLYQYFVELRQAYYYYRADFTPTPPLPNAAAWSGFVSTELDISPDKGQQQFLNSWISRTREPYS